LQKEALVYHPRLPSFHNSSRLYGLSRKWRLAFPDGTSKICVVFFIASLMLFAYSIKATNTLLLLLSLLLYEYYKIESDS